MSGNGWIALHRKLQDNFLWKEKRKFSKAEAWIDILMEAQHSEKPQEVVIGMTVLKSNYGECLKSEETWANRWGWSKSKVHRFLKLLESRSMIVTKNELVTTRITVCNYGKYNTKQKPDRTQIERQQNDNRTQAGTDNNDNKVNNENKYSPNSEEFQLSSLLLDLILERKPDFKRPNLQKWAKHIDYMISLDNRTPARIEAVIKWCQSDSFWQSNILSTDKLREKFDMLELQSKRKTNNAENRRHNRQYASDPNAITI